MSKAEWQALGDAMRSEAGERLAREAHRDRCEALVPELVAALHDQRRWMASAFAANPESGETVAKNVRAQFEKLCDALAKAEGKDTST